MLMLRDYKLYEYTWEGGIPIVTQNPEAPGSGEMVRTGEYAHEQRKLRIIARTRRQADAIFEDHFQYSSVQNPKVISVEEKDIDYFAALIRR